MKKLLIALCVAILLLGLIACVPNENGSVAFAEEGEAKTYKAYFSYNNIMQSGSGVFRSFELSIDKDYFTSLKVADVDLFYATLKNMYSSSGYNISISESGEYFAAYINFDSLTDMYIAYGIDGYEKNDNSGVSTDKSFFYVDTTVKQQTVFGLIDEGSNLLSATVLWLNTLGVSNDEMLFQYLYATPYKIINSDADVIQYDDSTRLYYHTFDMEYAERNKEITMYQHSPNSAGWYTIAIAIGLVVLIVPLTLCIIHRKKAKEGGYGK